MHSYCICAAQTLINPLTLSVAIWVQLSSIRVPGCQKLQMTA